MRVILFVLIVFSSCSIIQHGVPEQYVDPVNRTFYHLKKGDWYKAKANDTTNYGVTRLWYLDRALWNYTEANRIIKEDNERELETLTPEQRRQLKISGKN